MDSQGQARDGNSQTEIKKQKQEKKGSDFVAFSVREGKDGGKGFWTRIGAAWAHDDQLEPVPLDSKIALRAPTMGRVRKRAPLFHAMLAACQAQEAISRHEQNPAIGSIFDLDRKLEDAQALYCAAVALQRKGGS